MNTVAAVVILYNTDLNVLDNFNTYINQVEKLFIIDNSDFINDSLIKNIQLIENAEYICNSSNLGIAAALNLGAKRAMDEGFEYLLTMDQDSKATSEMVKNLFLIMKSASRIGIVTPEYIHSSTPEIRNNTYTKEILYTITSGNLLNLLAFKEVGGYLEKLFIDHVDHEFCLRLNRYGYKVIKTNKAFLYHRVGNTVIKKFFRFSFCPSYHPPLRLYYRTRNRFYVDSIYKKIFPQYVKDDIRHFIREMLEIIIYEKDLWNKFKMVIKGYSHFKKNKMGKYTLKISS